MQAQSTTVGVIGGGQLAWMMAQEAPGLGLTLVVQTPDETDPAVSLAQSTVLAAIADVQGTQTLAQHCDVITFENEFVDLGALQTLADQGTVFYPRLDALVPLLDKWEQRRFLQGLGLPVPDFWALESLPARPMPFPWVLKARRFGYDGQGTQVFKTAAELPDLSGHPPGTWLVEGFVPYERELAIIGARSTTGDIQLYPVVETVQVNQVCRSVIAPAAIDPAIAATIADYCRQILIKLDYVGVLAIELFLLPASPQHPTPDTRLFINELAPRTHNSGHYTLDACATSQFALQLQAVTGQPLGSTQLTCEQAVMINLLGYEVSNADYQTQREQIAALPHTHLHWYGKTDARPGRKLGHVTVLWDQKQPDQVNAAHQAIAAVEAMWYPPGFR
ncbi:MAG: 5-(carboxyamino)imidazole ribonucleotide synthase [Synechocystis sp.]|nr:5-(carboxyamino)imidazole ribonucleotide synthase [Synechocystis sp.]